MSKITLTTVTNGQNISAINSNFSALQDALNNSVFYRLNPVGEPNQLNNDIDVNGNKILNVDSLDVQNLTVAGDDITHTADIAVAAAAAASASATSAAASAASASSTLANALIKTNNLSDVQNPATARANIGAAGLTANTYSGVQTYSFDNVSVVLNDTSGVGTASLYMQSNGVNEWQIRKGTSNGFNIDRYVGGSFIDSPFSIVNASGVVTFTASPVLPTPATSDNSTNGATTAYTRNIINGGIVPASFTSINGTAPLTLTGTQPFVVLIDTAQTSPAGRFRMVSNANQWQLQRNTAGAGDFSTNSIPLYVDAVNRVHQAGGNGTTLPAAGEVGEYIQATATGLALVSGSSQAPASITITPGTWLIQASVRYNIGTGCTVTAYAATWSTSATGSVALGQSSVHAGVSVTSGIGIVIASTPAFRFTVTSNTTIYANSFALFSGGTLTGDGFVGALRV